MKNTNENQNNKEPVKKFSAGTITASIWENEGTDNAGKPKKFNTVSLQKRYKDKEGEWQTANSYNASDLPKLKIVIDEAYKFVALKESE